MKNRHKNILKKAALITAVYLLMPESADALTGGARAGGTTAIAGIDNLWRVITPYLAAGITMQNPTHNGDRTNQRVAINSVGKIACFLVRNLLFMRELLISSAVLEYHKNGKNTSFLRPYTCIEL
jgi:hypothetical protein